MSHLEAELFALRAASAELKRSSLLRRWFGRGNSRKVWDALCDQVADGAGPWLDVLEEAVNALTVIVAAC